MMIEYDWFCRSSPMTIQFSANFRGSPHHQFDLQALIILVCAVFTWLFIYLRNGDELSKALFVQSCLTATWTVTYALRIFVTPAPEYRRTLLAFRCSVTILNGAALIMMIYYEDFGLCLLLVVSILLGKSIFIAGPTLCPQTCSFIEWLLISMGCSGFFLTVNLNWWSCYGDILNRPIDSSDYAAICQCLFLFGSVVSILQIVPWSSTISSTKQFYVSLVVIFSTLFLPQAYFFVQENPFVWLFDCLVNKRNRLHLLSMWLIIAACAVALVYLHMKLAELAEVQYAKTIVRKYFHFLAIIVYTSGVLIDAQLLTMCSVAFVVLLLLLECMKVKRVAPLGNLIRDAWSMYENEKDTGPLMVSHLFLIVGLSYPVWVASDKQILARLSGVLSVGIGDSAASIVGSKVGVWKWPGSKRTLEGSFAGLLAQFVFVVLLWRLGIIPYSQYNLLLVSLGLLVTTQLEAFSHDIDNLTLPICLFPFLYACETF